MIEAWRIVKNEYADEAFSGDGAVLYAGRWHSEGTRLVYTAESLSVATLELLVHLPRPRIPSLTAIPCTFDESLVHVLGFEKLPENWSDAVAPLSLRRFGDEWVRRGTSAVMRVPSAVTLVEFNYLLNPEHPDFASIRSGEPRPFRLDYRLVN